MTPASGYLKVWLLAIVCLALGFGVNRQLDRQTELSQKSLTSPVRQNAAPDTERTPGFKALPDIADLDQTVDRPLFAQSRRPGVPAPVQQAVTLKQKKAPFELELSGVMIVGAQRVALLKTAKSNKVLSGKLGQTVEGWKIHKIEPNRVELGRSGKTKILKLEDRPQISQRALAAKRKLRKRQVQPVVQPRQPVAIRGQPPQEEPEDELPQDLLPRRPVPPEG